MEWEIIGAAIFGVLFGLMIGFIILYFKEKGLNKKFSTNENIEMINKAKREDKKIQNARERRTRETKERRARESKEREPRIESRTEPRKNNESSRGRSRVQIPTSSFALRD